MFSAAAFGNETGTTKLNKPTWGLLGKVEKGEVGVNQPGAEMEREKTGRGACLKGKGSSLGGGSAVEALETGVMELLLAQLCVAPAPHGFCIQSCSHLMHAGTM